MTRDIAKLMSDRDYHLKKTKRNKAGYHWEKFRKLRNSVHRHIEKAKSDNYLNLLLEYKGDFSKFLKGLKMS